MARRSPYPRSFWDKAVAAVCNGESLGAVARRYGVTISALTYWRNKLRGEQAFLPVVVAGQHAEPTQAGLLDLAVDGVLLRFGEDVTPEYVGRLVTALRSR